MLIVKMNTCYIDETCWFSIKEVPLKHEGFKYWSFHKMFSQWCFVNNKLIMFKVAEQRHNIECDNLNFSVCSLEWHIMAQM